MIEAFRAAFAEWWWGPVYLVEVAFFYDGDARPLRCTFGVAAGLRARSRMGAVARALAICARGDGVDRGWAEVRVEARRA